MSEHVREVLLKCTGHCRALTLDKYLQFAACWNIQQPEGGVQVNWLLVVLQTALLRHKRWLELGRSCLQGLGEGLHGRNLDDMLLLCAVWDGGG